MTIAILRGLAIDAESTFGTAVSTDYADYSAPPARNIEWAAIQNQAELATQTLGLGESCAAVSTTKRGTLSFDVPILPATTTGTTGAAATEPAWRSLLMGACGYTQVLREGTTISGASSSTTVLDVTNGEATKVPVGTIVIVSGEARVVTVIDAAQNPDDVTVTPALSGIPSAAVVVYGGVQ